MTNTLFETARIKKRENALCAAAKSKRMFCGGRSLSDVMNPEDENIVRIPVKITKRTPGETTAYIEGFLAGLRAARDGIDKSIDNYQRTLELFKTSGVAGASPGL